MAGSVFLYVIYLFIPFPNLKSIALSFCFGGRCALKGDADNQSTYLHSVWCPK